MTKSLPLSAFRVQLNDLCQSPQELVVTEQDEPLFALLPYDMYQSLIETLDIVADGNALSTLQHNLATIKAGKPLKTYLLPTPPEDCQVGLTETANRALQALDEPSIRELSGHMKALAHMPEKQGKALVGSLKGYRSLKTGDQRYQIIYFIETKQVVVVFVHSAVIQPSALLLHLLK